MYKTNVIIDRYAKVRSVDKKVLTQCSPVSKAPLQSCRISYLEIFNLPIDSQHKVIPRGLFKKQNCGQTTSSFMLYFCVSFNLKLLIHQIVFEYLL